MIVGDRGEPYGATLELARHTYTLAATELEDSTSTDYVHVPIRPLRYTCQA